MPFEQGRSEPLAPGSASAAASAATAAAVRSPEFARAATQFMQDPAAPASAPDEPAETPDSTPDDRDEGPSPSPDEPEGDQQEAEEDVQDDYDEEDHAVEAEDEPSDRPKTTPDETPDQPADDIEKTWAQYRTEDDRKRALHENKRYGIENAEKAKALEAENAELRARVAAPAPDTKPEPTKDEDTIVAETIKNLYDTDKTFRGQVDSLEPVRLKIADNTKVYNETRTAIAQDEQQAQRLKYRLEDLQADLKADPDNMDLERKIERTEREIVKLETSVDSRSAKVTRIEIETGHLQDRYNAAVLRFHEIGRSHVARGREEAKAQAGHEERVQKAHTEWTATFPAVLAEVKLTLPTEKAAADKLRQRLNHRLLERADSFLGSGGRITDLKTWMTHEVNLIQQEYSLVQGQGARQYIEQKRRDATPTGPKGKAAVAAAPSQTTSRLSSREADRQAAQSLRQSVRSR